VPTETGLLTLAGEAAKRTTTSWDEYLGRIRHDPSYAYRNTQWHRAGAYLEAIKHLPPPPPPDAPGALADAQGRIFLGTDPLAVLDYPAWMVPVVSADPNEPEGQQRATIDQLHARFGKVEAWADCMATPYSAAVALVQRLGLQGAWGQCETQPQFDAAVGAGARRLVGKVDASVLGDPGSARFEMVNSRQILVSVEQYGYTPAPDFRTPSLGGVAGTCIATYQSAEDHPEPRTVDGYKHLGYYTPHVSSVYVGDGTPIPDAASLG
jgi:hypothetical protein